MLTVVRFEAVPSAGNKVVAGAGEESWSTGPGGITLVEQEHIPSPFGDTFLMGVIWWDGRSNRLGGIECNSQLPMSCDLKVATQMGDVTQPDGTTAHFMTIHGRRVKALTSIGAG